MKAPFIIVAAAVLLGLPVFLPGAVQGEGAVLPLGERGFLQVADDGRFELVSGQTVVGPSSHWSFRMDGRALAPGTSAFSEALATPLRGDASNARMVLQRNGVFAEMYFLAENGTALLMATVVNAGARPASVGMRCALELRVPEVYLNGLGTVCREYSFSPSSGSTITGLRGSAQAFSCVLPDAPSVAEFICAPEYAVDSEWDFPINPSLNLTSSTGVLLFWSDRVLSPGEYCRATVQLSAGAPENPAPPRTDLSVSGVGTYPPYEYERMPRRVSATLNNAGAATTTELTVLFMRDTSPLSMKVSPLTMKANDTARLEDIWSPPMAGNFSVGAILPFALDKNPGDNILLCSTLVPVNPYRYVLKFVGDAVSIHNTSYAGGKMKAQFFLYNTGFANDSIRLTVEGLPDRWTALFTANLVNLEVNQMAYIWLTVKPSYAATNGTFAFTVVSTSVASQEQQVLLVLVDIGGAPPPSANNNGEAPIPIINPTQGNNTPPPTPIKPYPNQDDDDDGFLPQLSKSSLGWGALTVIGVLLAACLIAVALYQAAGWRTLSVMQRIIKRALYGLAHGDEYQKVIFEAYMKMCAHLEKYGYTRGEAVTPREFELALKRALPIDTRSIKVLTRLFEEARYSDHRMGARSRSAAILSLRYVEKELGRLTTFEGHHTPWEKLKRRMLKGQ